MLFLAFHRCLQALGFSCTTQSHAPSTVAASWFGVFSLSNGCRLSLLLHRMCSKWVLLLLEKPSNFWTEAWHFWTDAWNLLNTLNTWHISAARQVWHNLKMLLNARRISTASHLLNSLLNTTWIVKWNELRTRCLQLRRLPDCFEERASSGGECCLPAVTLLSAQRRRPRVASYVRHPVHYMLQFYNFRVDCKNKINT